ncbi:MAG: hypothetical protein ACU84H_08990 [Gammaproteobacteria bacterium]
MIKLTHYASRKIELGKKFRSLMKTIISLKYTSLLIIVIGLCLAFTSDKTAVTVTMLTLGVCMFILNELLPRLEGKLEIGPKGLSATLSEAKLVAQKSIQSSPPATLTLPKLQIKGGTQSAEISWSGMGKSPPFKLTEAGNFSFTVEYIIPNGKKFQVSVPIEFHQTETPNKIKK